MPGLPTGDPTTPGGNPDSVGAAPYKAAFQNMQDTFFRLVTENWPWIMFFIVLYMVIELAPLVWRFFHRGGRLTPYQKSSMETLDRDPDAW